MTARLPIIIFVALAVVGLAVGVLADGHLQTVGFTVAVVSLFASVAIYRQEREFSEQLEAGVATIDHLEQQSENLKRASDVLADGLQIALFSTDTKGQVVHANTKARDMFNFASPTGKSILAITLSYELERMILDCVQTLEPVLLELSFNYPKEMVATCEVWPEPGGSRFYLSLYEITDLRKLERIRQDFVANVSHELRTPLTSIRTIAETLLDEPDAEPTRRDRYLQKVMSEVDRLSSIAGDLLVLSTAELNTVRKQACDLAEVTKSVVSQLEPKARERELELTYDGPDSLIVEANQTQITQVIINLIDNSLNYTSKGSVTVTLSTTEDGVELAVKDTGFGIASEHLGRIFERFYRVDKGRSRASGGTGLGLSIVKHIVEAHGGRVSVESALNQGSTFKMHLPPVAQHP